MNVLNQFWNNAKNLFQSKPLPAKEAIKAHHVIDIKGTYYVTDRRENFVSEINPRNSTPFFNPFPKV